MKELTEQDLQDYANHFNALISALKLGMDLNEYRLKMPHEYLFAKYPERYKKVTYPDSFEYRRLEVVVDYFNEQLQKTKKLLQRLLTIVGEIIYGDSTQFVRALPY